MVLVSRRAFMPVSGSTVLTQSSRLAKGDSPVPEGRMASVCGNTSGSSDSGTGFMVPSSRCRIGMGSPQYRWRLNSQSRRR
ncbi:hypothetical protein D3C75_669350 [compost metagenome]